MQISKRNLLTGVAIAAALAAGYGVATFRHSEPDAAHGEESHGEEGHSEAEGQPKAEESFITLAADQATAAGVAVVTVGRGGGSDIRLTGRVEAAPNARAVIGAPVAGVVERVLLSPGAQIGAGGGVAVIRSADGALVRAEASAAAAEAQAAQAALAREDRLLKAGVTARQDWEAARAAQVRASAQATAAQARVAASGSPGAGGQTTIRSPIAGLVTSVQVAPGGFVAQGAPVAEVSDPTRLEVVFNVPADSAARLRVGDHLKLVGPDGREAAAEIIGVAPLSQGSTGAAMVRARPLDGGLTPGAAVSAQVPADGKGLPSVPSEAVQTVEGRSVVFVAEAKGFRARSVTTGRTGGGQTQIVAGLKGDERVAGRGAFVLKAELAKGEAEHGH
jgi:cobalt-zinc-cadmium efflux system membrane fusion protein